jgi:ssDNA-binding Zn-finger/Zn-ribbon topoisomerase 1
MGYCKIHGHFVGDTCDDCSDAEQRAESDRAEMIERLEELRDSAPDAADIAYAINNPGDHECPHCRYRTLRLDASRCPKCHSTISPDHWVPIRRQLALQREAEERRAKIAAEARSQAAAQAAQTAAREASERSRREKKALFAKIYFGYLVPVLSFSSCFLYAGLFMGYSFDSPPVGDIVALLLPGVNWLALIGALTMAPKNIEMIRGAFVIWTAVGFVIYALL